MNTTQPQPGTQHVQNFSILAPLLGLDIGMNSQYSTWPASTQLSILRGSLMFKIGAHIIDEHVAERTNTTLLNLSAAELLGLLSDSTTFDAKIVELRDQYTAESRHQQAREPRTPVKPIPTLTSPSPSFPDEPSHLSDEDEFISEGHSTTPELRNGQSPLARANRLLFGLGNVAVGGVGGILRTASGTALGLGQTALGAVASRGARVPMSPVHRSLSERLLGSPTLRHAGGDEGWEMMGARELELNARFGDDRVGGQQVSGSLEEEEEGDEGKSWTPRMYRPRREGLEEELAEAMNGRM